jgi:hypothetical protein
MVYLLEWYTFDLDAVSAVHWQDQTAEFADHLMDWEMYHLLNHAAVLTDMSFIAFMYWKSLKPSPGQQYQLPREVNPQGSA